MIAGKVLLRLRSSKNNDSRQGLLPLRGSKNNDSRQGFVAPPEL